jgi:hypothetical protein
LYLKYKEYKIMAIILVPGGRKSPKNLKLQEAGYSYGFGDGDIGELKNNDLLITRLVARSNGKVSVRDSGGTDFFGAPMAIVAKGQALAVVTWNGNDEYDSDEGLELYSFLNASQGSEIILSPLDSTIVDESIQAQPFLQAFDNTYAYGTIDTAAGTTTGTVGGLAVKTFTAIAEGPTHEIGLVLDGTLDAYAVELKDNLTGDVIVLTAHENQLGNEVLANNHFSSVVDVIVDTNTSLYERLKKATKNSGTVTLGVRVIPRPDIVIPPAAPVVLTSFTAVLDVSSIAVAGTSQASATIPLPAGAAFGALSYVSGTPANATVDGAGVVTGVLVGTSVITITDDATAVTSDVTITVA